MTLGDKVSRSNGLADSALASAPPMVLVFDANPLRMADVLTLAVATTTLGLHVLGSMPGWLPLAECVGWRVGGALLSGAILTMEARYSHAWSRLHIDRGLTPQDARENWQW